MKNGPILIGGCGSSGTTLLRKMLNCHPNIACGPELSVFDRPKMYENSLEWFYTMWRAQDFDSMDDGCIFPMRVHPMNTTYFGLKHENNMKYYHSPEEVEKMFSNEVETPLDFVDAFLTNHALNEGKTRWAEKTPNNIFCADRWLDHFPDGVFIEVVRDARDCIFSLNERRNMPIFAGVYRWLAAVRKGHYLTLSNKYWGRIFNIRYENLIENPESVLISLCEFLGEAFCPDMLEYWKKPLPEEKSSEKNKLDYGTQPIFKDSIGKWKKNGADKTKLEMIELVCHENLFSLGYEDCKTIAV